MEIHTSLYPYMYHGKCNTPLHPYFNKKKETTKENNNETIDDRIKIDFTSQFWIFYFILTDIDNYILNNNDFKVKQKIIYNVLENISNYKNIFSKYSYFKKNRLIASLTNKDNDDITLLEFSFLSAINDIIILVKNKQFFYTNYPKYSNSMNILEDELDINVKKFVFIDENEKYIKIVNEQEFKDKVISCREHNLNVSNPEKLLYSVSSYKMQEIYDIASKMDIDYNVKVKKIGIYKCILDNIGESLFFKMN